jgi:hypothetical protein
MLAEQVLAAVTAAVAFGVFGLEPALAQDADNVTVDVGRCVELESAEERLACYAAEVDAVVEERGAVESEQAAPVREERGTREPSTQDAPQHRQERLAPTRGDTRQADESREPEAEDEYFGTVATLRERLPDSYVITLDNGQIWEQVRPKRYPLRPGLEVRIYATSWGESYRLSGLDSGGYIQVRRIR